MIPKLTIVTPSYNQGCFLEKTICSVLNQNYPNLEYIIIDGGSNDNSVDVIKKYEKHLSYWVSEKDSGQTDAINKGVRKSTGDILGWINSDDVYVKGTFQKVIKAFEKHPECIVVHGNRVLINEHDHVIGWTTLPPLNPLSYGYTVCSETAFWRRSANNQVGELNDDLQFAMDLDFFCRLYMIGNFWKLDSYLGCFRCYSNNKSSTIPHIGIKEAAQQWHLLFGEKNENWSRKPKQNQAHQVVALLKHPRLIMLPYLQYRFNIRRS